MRGGGSVRKRGLGACTLLLALAWVACASLPEPPEAGLAARLAPDAELGSATTRPVPSEAVLVWLDPELEESDPPPFLVENQRRNLLDALLASLRPHPFTVLSPQPDSGALATVAASGDVEALREAARQLPTEMVVVVEMRSIQHHAANYLAGGGYEPMQGSLDLGAVATAELCAVPVDATASVACAQSSASTLSRREHQLNADTRLRILTYEALEEAATGAATELAARLSAAP